MSRLTDRVAASANLLLDLAQARGLPVEALEVAVDGAVRLLTHRPAAGAVATNEDADWVELAGATKDSRRA